MESLMLAAGCFWGVEEEFRTLNGVHSTKVGYSGGVTENPTYEEVCTGKTLHAEVLLIEFDPKVISLAQILEKFWEIHDPTQLNRQGPDIGTQYRSGLYYYTDEQLLTIKESIKSLKLEAIATEILPAKTFFAAEEYHQQYLHKKQLSACPLR